MTWVHKPLIRSYHLFLQSGTSHHSLKGRTRLINKGNRPVAPCAFIFPILIRIVAWTGSHRQYITISWVHDNSRNCVWISSLNCSLQSLLNNKLNITVNSKGNILALFRASLFGRHETPHRMFLLSPLAGFYIIIALNESVHTVLNAVTPLILCTDKT